jgi:hypothetical protein
LLRGRDREQSLKLPAQGKALLPLLSRLADSNDEHFFVYLKPEVRQLLIDIMQNLIEHYQLKENQ